MKTVVGFSFTDSPVQHLTDLGFSFHGYEETLKYGYREFSCCFESLNKQSSDPLLHLEIREVIDEVVYFKFQSQKNFSPFIAEKNSLNKIDQHLNGAIGVEEVLFSDIENSEMKKYFLLKKKYPLWAVWLKCRDLKKFENYDSDFFEVVEWRNQKALLIPMGPLCYDLLITEKIN